MAAVMQGITHIGKDSKNQSQGFSFRGIDTVYNELHNLFAKHGIITMPVAGVPVVEERTNSKGTVLRFVQIPMTYNFIADDGSFVSSTVIGEGMDSGDKATNKAMAIAHKYALIQTFMIPTEDMKDPDSESHEVVTRKPVAKATPTPKQEKPAKVVDDKDAENLSLLYSLMDKSGVDEATIFDFLTRKGADLKGAAYVRELPSAIVSRLIEVWNDIIGKEDK